MAENLPMPEAEPPVESDLAAWMVDRAVVLLTMLDRRLSIKSFATIHPGMWLGFRACFQCNGRPPAPKQVNLAISRPLGDATAVSWPSHPP